MMFKAVYLHVEEVRGIFNYIFNFKPVNVSVEVLFLNPSMYRHVAVSCSKSLWSWQKSKNLNLNFNFKTRTNFVRMKKSGQNIQFMESKVFMYVVYFSLNVVDRNIFIVKLNTCQFSFDNNTMISGSQTRPLKPTDPDPHNVVIALSVMWLWKRVFLAAMNPSCK